MTPALTLGAPGDLSGFPAVPPPARLVRVCRAARATWWFSADGSGRFDLNPPEGTCYLATDAYAAIREATRLGPVSTVWVNARELREVAFRDHGFDGIRHQLRHDQRARPSGVAMFGPAGAATSDDGRQTPLTADAVQAAGVEVLAPPSSASLTIKS